MKNIEISRIPEVRKSNAYIADVMIDNSFIAKYTLVIAEEESPIKKDEFESEFCEAFGYKSANLLSLLPIEEL